VPAAVIYDLGIGDSSVRPGPEQGALAYLAATDDAVEMGNVGAATGATVAGWRGPEHRRRGGLGSCSLQIGGAVVGALAVVNAVGDVFTLEGEPLTGGSPVPAPMAGGPAPGAGEHTTLVLVATDAGLDRTLLQRLCVRGHDALGVCLRPGHTRYDGDTVFAVSCGDRSADPDVIGEAAFTVVGRAVEAAVRAATSAAGIPAVEDDR
jgi:L-aminopeptidase/D-esterase-like protein